MKVVEVRLVKTMKMVTYVGRGQMLKIAFDTVEYNKNFDSQHTFKLMAFPPFSSKPLWTWSLIAPLLARGG